MERKIKLALVDDQNLCRCGLSELFGKRYDFSVLGATGTLEGLRLLLQEEPDLIIMDLRMKPMDGLDLLEQLRREGCPVPVVILTMSDSEQDLTRAIRAGARGYLLKDMSPEEVVDGIRRIASGELVVAPAMTIKMINILRGEQPTPEHKNPLKLLTEREREILQLLSRGESNKSIANSLSISYDTVKQHVRHILTKLNLSSRVKAAVLFTSQQQTDHNERGN